MKNILLVEPDQSLGLLLKENLIYRGLNVYWCKDGEEGLNAFAYNKFDLCITEILLPKKDGFTMLNEIRKTDNKTPLIFLTTCTQEDHVAKAFELGCDDYVTKPFSAQELYLRMIAIARRSGLEPNNSVKKMQIGKFNFDYGRRILCNGEEQKKVSSKEAELLYTLAKNKNNLIDKKNILLQVWGVDSYFNYQSLNVYLTRLRKILSSDPSIKILNAYGSGYKLSVID